MKYEYLTDYEFLKSIDFLNIQTTFVRINVLNKEDLLVAGIEGRATGGNINLNGNSAVRRTGSLTMVADEDTYRITDVQNLISINKRIELEIGIKNLLKQEFPQYAAYDIIWFNLGVFIISSATINHNNQGINISLNLKDKMALLNGEAGGTLTAAITHTPIDEVMSDGTIETIPVRFRDLIFTLVSELGGISKEKILIDDIPLRIKNLLRWGADQTVYLVEQDGGSCFLTTTKPEGGNYSEYNFNDNVGYAFTDFTYPTDKSLDSAPGEAITSVLDKIKSQLGNYEYYFDLDGIFHFQEIKNYINEGSSLEDLGEALNDKYFLRSSIGQSVYDFTSGALINAYSNAPKYANIKNDITVWGQLPETKTGIRYHVAIDSPPKTFNTYYVKLFTDDGGVIRAEQVSNTVKLEGSKEITPKDWRTELYFNYILDKKNNAKYYSKELEEEWPKIYDIEKGQWKNINPNTLTYYFDMIDPEILQNQTIKGLSIDSLGRREKVINDTSINCLFSFMPNDICFIKAGQGMVTKQERNECIKKGQAYAQVSPGTMDQLFIGTAQNAAFDLLRSSLTNILEYNETINLTAVPIYYLEPNTMITVNDPESDIHGEYMINSISIPLALNGNMTINATRVIEQI